MSLRVQQQVPACCIGVSIHNLYSSNNSLIHNFDVHFYVELSELKDDVLCYILLGGIEPTTLLDNESKKELICLCAKCVCSESACYKRALLFLENMKQFINIFLTIYVHVNTLSSSLFPIFV